MTNAVSANQKSNSWKVIQLTVKPQYTSQVAKMTEQPDKKLLNVRQLVHAKQFEHGRPQAVFHIYRVQTATSP
jgi:hypothetical protein